MVEPLKRIGRTVVAVVPEGDQAIGAQAEWVLPVLGNVSELFSPMVYAVAGELYSAYLSEVTGEPPFRRFVGVYQDGGNTIKTSQVLELGRGFGQPHPLPLPCQGRGKGLWWGAGASRSPPTTNIATRRGASRK